jgi:3-oxoacyl-[acyl-carrier protein] reductase
MTLNGKRDGFTLDDLKACARSAAMKRGRAEAIVKIALVTAASRGLGRGCARALAAEGARVALCSRDGDQARAAAGEIAADTGAEVVGFGADVSQADAIDRLLDGVRSALGNPDILVTNAGGPPPGTYATTPLSAYPEALNLTLMSAVRLIAGVTEAMKANGWGRVIAITSISVKQPIGNLLLSNMARAGLTGFLKTVSTELAPFGITVNALLPGLHRTDRVDQLARATAERDGRTPETVLAEMTAAVPSGTIGDPDDFGAAAAFLAGDPARYITGQNLLVDGGRYTGLL